MFCKFIRSSLSSLSIFTWLGFVVKSFQNCCKFNLIPSRKFSFAVISVCCHIFAKCKKIPLLFAILWDWNWIKENFLAAKHQSLSTASHRQNFIYAVLINHKNRTFSHTHYVVLWTNKLFLLPNVCSNQILSTLVSTPGKNLRGENIKYEKHLKNSDHDLRVKFVTFWVLW